MTVSVAVIALCMVVIMLAAIATLLRIRRVAIQTEKLVDAVKIQLGPVIHDVTLISADVRSIVRTLEREAPKISDGIEALRNTARDVHEFERMLRERIERPLLDVASLISGILRGVQVFWKTMWRR